ncbi:MAG: putative lipid II flippase FtsW [Bacillota bacterium]|jgi:cell division protein FtsW|nr:putative lipid II flippase FtsW [Bacillota bacterium]HOB41798.1 putative lipid II flippase FtsW [Bacillota bacterium]HOK70534.1 putative lipid II flippase FtsW [Bacillota bacterium]HOL50903.1 putative lipid II flippase FtsW [Bacillota bacterium]HOO29487.1 putative lipid II flippase FtsW [Bacillota bacterium]
MLNDRGGLPDLVIFVATLALLSIGIVMVFSASSVTAYHELGDPYYYLKRQSLWAIIGIAAMIMCMNIDYHVWERLAGLLMVLSLGALVLVLVPGVGIVVSGSRRWLGVESIRVQPSEFAKLSLVVFLASYLSASQARTKSFFRGFLLPMMIIGACSVLVLKEPDLGTAIGIAGVGWFMLFAGGSNMASLIATVAAAIPAVYLFARQDPVRLRRLTSFLDPWADPLDSGFHIIQSLLALGSGGLVGVGLGLSRQKFHYLPEQHTDFIFAVIGEELGFLGAASVVLLYMIFGLRGFRTSLNAPDSFGSLLAAGITIMVTLQAMMNIAVVSGMMPITGITLPLISSGGSSLVPMLAGIGILLNVSKHVNQR